MKFLEHVLANLVSLAVGLVIILSVLGSTLGSAAFWESAAAQSGLYEGLAATTPGVPAAQIQAGVEPLIPQLITRYAAGGPVPLLDINAFAKPVAGVAVAPVPITAGSADDTLIRLIGYAKIVQLVSAVVAVVLIGLVLLIMGERRVATLIRAAAWCTISTAISAGVCFLLPTILGFVMTSNDIAAIKPVLLKFLGEIGSRLGTELLIFAGGLLVITIGLVVLNGYLKVHRKFVVRSVAKSAVPTEAK